MYYYCTKLNAFKLPPLCERVPGGGVIAASAVPYPQLARRSLMPYGHLQHRVLDPQLYLASLDPRTATSMVYKLATYPWFGSEPPTFQTGLHRTFAAYKEQVMPELLHRWPRAVAMDDEQIYRAVRSCLQIQIELGCEALIAPSPLTNTNTSYTLESKYLDAAAEVANELQVRVPVYASVAIADGLLRGQDPTQNVLLQTITDQIASRRELAGAYIVLEQAVDTGYVCVNEDVLFALLILIDDLSRGASKQAIVNYIGPFGAAAVAAGATVWSSGYYRSQRRMRLSDQEEDVGRAYPRFYSAALAGDIGVQLDLLQLSHTPLLQQVFSRTQASRSLLHALQTDTYPQSSPDWEYRPGNIWAAAAHYNDVCCKQEAFFDSHDQRGRIEFVDRWLCQAERLAGEVRRAGVDPTHTDLRHQSIWRSAYQRWRQYAQM